MRTFRGIPYARTAGLVAVLLAAVPAGRVGAQHYVPTGDPDHPRIRYADSLLSANDRCIVAKQKLNVKVRPVYVNGMPIGFC